MRFFLFVFLWGLTSTAFATTSPNSTPVNSAPIIANTQNSQDLMYQQLFSMQSQLVRLDEKLQQQKSLGNDFKTLEAAQQALKAQLANLQTKLETQEKLQTNQMNGVDGRISDIASNTNMWGMAFTIFGLIITVAAVGLGFNAKNRAVYEAKQAANTASESHMEKWLLDNKGKLISETKVELEKVSLELKERAEKLATEASAALNKIERDLIEESKRIITSNKGETGKGLSKHSKSPTRASAKNWFKVGLSAFEKNEYDEALKAWAKVLQLLDQKEEPELYAVTLMNQGITHGRLAKPDDELNSYEALIEQFKDSSNEEIQIQVAKAMINQGIAYGQQGKPDEELSSYATLIEQFKSSANEEIQIQVAKAMINQGITYGQQGKLDNEIRSYATLIEQFKSSANEEVQIQVTMAMYNQGVAYGQQGKLDNELRSYATLIEQFKGSANEEVQIQVAEAMCSQSAVYGLNKDFLTALKSHSMLLEAFHNSENSEIKKIIANSKANIAEQALLYETPEQVLIRVAEAEKYSENPQLLAVMQFIRFLLDDKSIEEVFTALTKIPTEMELKWAFREINDYLTDNFEGIKQQQIQAVVQYFEQHKDIEQLRVELGIKG
ncbi:tetratricopeptide repeat protein [Pseudoalteromonas sp. 2CM39R]|uniref:tetratricopeptide repeat protein n=1 Tax=Pseudoalteromonas sp. 2CM39R TaxID=2929856 RepID=UPI0020C121FC|nr:tetratricopeptide repeat protein [Pseudoalteromonas sp. 2CM39R]MCK8128292.1 tetratricopeptide repeat protein [Pseudoalteromonas sp. 2CM39R]